MFVSIRAPQPNQKKGYDRRCHYRSCFAASRCSVRSEFAADRVRARRPSQPGRCCERHASLSFDPRALLPPTLRSVNPGPNWIEAMDEHDTHAPPPVPEQIYLLERATGLLCRILGLYASRGIDVQRADYAFAAPGSGPLKAATIEWAP